MLNEVKSSSFIAVIAVSILLRIAFAFATPNWQAPDEYPHFYVLKHLALTGSLVKSKPEFPTYEGFQPPLYYFITAQLYKIVLPWDKLPPDPNYSIDPDTDTQSRNGALIFLRLFSVALGTLTLLVIFKIGLLIFPNTPDCSLLTLALAGFLPTFIVNSASVTNDALANLIGAVLLWMLLLPPGRFEALWVGIVLGLGMLTKASIWMFVLLVPVALFLRQKDLVAVARKSFIVLLVALVISGWFFLRNFNRYGNILAILPGFEKVSPLSDHTLADFWRVVRNMNWSFWAAAGRTYEIHLAPVVYVVVFLPLTLLALAGVARMAFKRIPMDSGKFPFEISGHAFLTLGIILAAEVLAAMYYSLMYPINCAWGKYVYPVLPAIAILFVTGMYRMLGEAIAGRVLQIFNLVLLGVSGYLLWMLASA
ncbi:MAG: hypothetical protein ABSF91_06910 [Bacteroidota bacterium]